MIFPSVPLLALSGTTFHRWLSFPEVDSCSLLFVSDSHLCALGGKNPFSLSSLTSHSKGKRYGSVDDDKRWEAFFCWVNEPKCTATKHKLAGIFVICWDGLEAAWNVIRWEEIHVFWRPVMLDERLWFFFSFFRSLYTFILFFQTFCINLIRKDWFAGENSWKLLYGANLNLQPLGGVGTREKAKEHHHHTVFKGIFQV